MHIIEGKLLFIANMCTVRSDRSPIIRNVYPDEMPVNTAVSISIYGTFFRSAPPRTKLQRLSHPPSLLRFTADIACWPFVSGPHRLPWCARRRRAARVGDVHRGYLSGEEFSQYRVVSKSYGRYIVNKHMTNHAFDQ